MNSKILLLLLLSLNTTVFAQQATLSGKIVDAKNGQPLSGANVILRDQNQYTETNNYGEFIITTEATGNQIIDIILLGFAEKSVPILLSSGKDTDLGIIQLSEEMNQADQSVSFVVDESQINDEDGSNQTIGSIGNASDDIYLNMAGYTFSPMRFSIRGYNQEYEQTYINGVSFNDGERGRFNYSSLGGMNSVFKNRTVSEYMESNSYSYGDIGGASNINTKSSNYAPGSSVSLAATNRSYILRALATYASGLNENGWAFNAAMAYRWSNEGAWDGTFYNSWAYFIGLEKIFNKNHSLSLVTFGSPTQRGQQGAVTQEVYDLAESIYYNPYWGYDKGKKRNSRVVDSFDPTVILSYEWKIDRNQNINIGSGLHYNNYSSTALCFYNAPDPRPDYYRNQPSYQEEETEVERLTKLWKSNTDYNQINWSRLRADNIRNNEVNPNGNAKYAVEERHNDIFETAINALYNGHLTSQLKLTGGIEAKYSQAKHYKTMRDLLGANQWIDIDQFAERDFPANPNIVQNDIDNPNRVIKEGDKFGYNYDMNIYQAKAFVQNEWTLAHLDCYYAGRISYSNFCRKGHMRNGRADYLHVQSKGKGKSYWFWDPSVKGGISYKFDGHNRISANILAESRAPLAYNAYISPRIKDTRVNNLKSERILSYDMSYKFNYLLIKGRISGFRTHYKDVAELTVYYDDSYQTFINNSISGLSKMYQGIEAAADVRINSYLSVTIAGTWADYRYTNNGNNVMSPENGSFDEISETVITKDLHVNSGPQIASAISLNFTLPNMLFAEITGSYYDKNYLDFAPNHYTESWMKEYTPEQKKALATQEKLPNGFLLDVSVGKVLYLNNRAQQLNINLNLCNILNNRKMITGGYQQGRLPIDTSTSIIDNTKLDKFTNKYYYAQGFNLFVNLGYKF